MLNRAPGTRPPQKRGFQESTLDATGRVTAASTLAHRWRLLPGIQPEVPPLGPIYLRTKLVCGQGPSELSAPGDMEASRVKMPGP